MFLYNFLNKSTLLRGCSKSSILRPVERSEASLASPGTASLLTSFGMTLHKETPWMTLHKETPWMTLHEKTPRLAPRGDSRRACTKTFLIKPHITQDFIDQFINRLQSIDPLHLKKRKELLVVFGNPYKPFLFFKDRKFTSSLL
jgi:hypothetical protein